MACSCGPPFGISPSGHSYWGEGWGGTADIMCYRPGYVLFVILKNCICIILKPGIDEPRRAARMRVREGLGEPAQAEKEGHEDWQLSILCIRTASSNTCFEQSSPQMASLRHHQKQCYTCFQCLVCAMLIKSIASVFLSALREYHVL